MQLQSISSGTKFRRYFRSFNYTFWNERARTHALVRKSLKTTNFRKKILIQIVSLFKKKNI